MWVVLSLAMALALAVAPLEAGGQDRALTGHWAYRWTRMYEDGAGLTGGGFGILIDARTRVELVGYGTAQPSRYSTLAFRLAHGGVQVTHDLGRRGRFAYGVGTALGYGVFSVEDRRSGTEDRTGVWLMEPEVFLGVDVGEHARLDLGASYRWVTGIEGDITNRSDGDARAPAVGLRLVVR
jgi:hypothetical protein